MWNFIVGSPGLKVRFCSPPPLNKRDERMHLRRRWTINSMSWRHLSAFLLACTLPQQALVYLSYTPESSYCLEIVTANYWQSCILPPNFYTFEQLHENTLQLQMLWIIADVSFGCLSFSRSENCTSISLEICSFQFSFKMATHLVISYSFF